MSIRALLETGKLLHHLLEPLLTSAARKRREIAGIRPTGVSDVSMLTRAKS